MKLSFLLLLVAITLGEVNADPVTGVSTPDPTSSPHKQPPPMRHLREAELQLPHVTTRGGALTLEEVLKSVSLHHPLLSAVEQERRIAEAELLGAEGAFDPSIKSDTSSYGSGYYTGNRQNVFLDLPVKELNGGRFIAGYRRSGGLFPIYEEEYYTNDGGEFRAGFELPLLRDGATDRRRANISRAELQRIAAEANIGQRRIDLVRAATNSYWEWVAAGNRHEIAKELLKVAELRQTQLDERVKRGDLPEFDLLDNRRSLLQRRAQLVAAERILQSSGFELSLFLRDGEGEQLQITRDRLPAELPEPKAENTQGHEELIEQALANRPELKRIAVQRRQNTVEQELAENQRLPRLDLSALAAQDSGDGRDSREEGEVKAGIKFEIPLMTRTADGRIEASKAKERELINLQQFARERIATDIRDSLLATRLAQERFQIAREEFRAARELEVGERDRFELGDSNLIFVNLREQTAAEAASRVVDSLLDYHRARASFRAALGQDSVR